MKSFVKDCALDINKEWISIITWTAVVVFFSFFLSAVVSGAKTAREAFSINTMMTALRLYLYAIGIIGVFLVILIVVVAFKKH